MAAEIAQDVDYGHKLSGLRKQRLGHLVRRAHVQFFAGDRGIPVRRSFFEKCLDHIDHLVFYTSVNRSCEPVGVRLERPGVR